ncbi:hypothetical protein D3C78_1487510 [compost metagenome]
MLLAIDDVGAHGEEKPGVHQYPFDPVLDLLDMQSRVSFELGQNRLEQPFDLDLGVLASGLARCDQRLANLVRIEGNQTAIAFVQPVASYTDQRAMHWNSKHYI